MNEQEKAAAFDRIVAARETGDMDSTFAAVEREIDVLPRLEDIFPTQLDGRPISGDVVAVLRELADEYERIATEHPTVIVRHMPLIRAREVLSQVDRTADQPNTGDLNPHLLAAARELADQLDVSGDRLRELLHEWVHGAGIPSDVDEAVRRVREATAGDR